MRLLSLLLAAACTWGPPPAPPGPTGQAADGSYHPSAPADLAKQAWRAAWVVGDKAVVPGAKGEGRLMDAKGARAAVAAGSCGAAPAFEGGGMLWLPPGEEQTFQPVPMVAAAVVERSAWKLAEVLGPPEGVLPGVDAKDPTLHQGIRVQAVAKLRRPGPPWQAIVGERRDRVALAIADGAATNLASGLVLRRSTDAPVDIRVATGGDVDGDGLADVVIAGDGPKGSFRAVVSVVGLDGGVVLKSFEEAPELSCP
jgi:hypothetical protein